jgi:hypothetical protein
VAPGPPESLPADRVVIPPRSQSGLAEC